MLGIAPHILVDVGLVPPPPLYLYLLTVSDILERLLLCGDHPVLGIAPHILVDVGLVHLHLAA